MDGDIAAIADQIMPTIHPTWLEALQSDRELLEGLVVRTANRITQGEDILPAPQNILRALATPVDQTKALIVGQDPYPTPGHAVGLSFSSYPDVFPFPKSLQNIFTEYESDLGYPRPATADLSPWVDQGVMLLNRVLTVRAGNAGSDQGLGWEGLTESVIRILASRQEPFVALLWGKPAQTLLPLIGAQRAVCSPHPSPLSAYRGFFGSHPFSHANELLISQGGQPIEWKLP